MSSDAIPLSALPAPNTPAVRPAPGRVRTGADGRADRADRAGADRSRRFHDALDQAARPDPTGTEHNAPGRRVEGHRHRPPVGPHGTRRPAPTRPDGGATADYAAPDSAASHRAGGADRGEPAATGAAGSERSDDPTGVETVDRDSVAVAASLQAQAATAAAPTEPAGTATATDGTAADDPLALDAGAGPGPVGSGTGATGGADSPLSPAVQPGTGPLPGTTTGSGATAPGEPTGAGAPAGDGTGPVMAPTGPTSGTGEEAATGSTASDGATAGTAAEPIADAAAPADGTAEGDTSGGSGDASADGGTADGSAPGRTATGPDRPGQPAPPAGGPLSALAPAAPASAPAAPAPTGRTRAATADGIDGPGGAGPRPGAADRAEADPRSLDGRLATALNGDPASGPTPAPASAPVNGSGRSAGADPLWRQVQRALNAVRPTADGNHEMTIRLRPDHLGSLTVKVTTSEAGTTVALVADSRAAAQHLEQQRHLLADELSGGGLRGATIDIGLGTGASTGGTPGRDGTGAATGSGSQASSPGPPAVGAADPRLDTGRAEALRVAARRRSTATVDLAL